MTLKDDKEILSVNTTTEDEAVVNSIEVIRRCSKEDKINTSWEQSYYASFHEQSNDSENKTPPFVSIMVTDIASPDDKGNNSTQTETALMMNCSIGDVSLSFNNYDIHDSTSNDNSEPCLRSKRHRRRSRSDKRELRPWKKTKCSESCTSSIMSDMMEPNVIMSSSTSLTSASDISFKSINSSHSFKVRKRRHKSESNLFRDVLQRSRKNINLCKYNGNDENTPGKGHDILRCE